MTMDFWDAVKAMDMGHTVRMVVNPEKYYRLANDGVTIVSRRMNDRLAPYVGCEPDTWQNALFFTRHIRGDWVVCDGELEKR